MLHLLELKLLFNSSILHKTRIDKICLLYQEYAKAQTLMKTDLEVHRDGFLTGGRGPEKGV